MSNKHFNPITLELASKKLRNVRNLKLDVTPLMLDFVEYMADIAEFACPYNTGEPFPPERMWCLAMDAIDNIKSNQFTSPPMPEVLKYRFAKIISHKDEFFQIISKISSNNFAEKFQALGNPLQ